MNEALPWTRVEFESRVLDCLNAEPFVTEIINGIAICHPLESRTPPTLRPQLVEVRLNVDQLYRDTPSLLSDARTYPQFDRSTDADAVLGLVVEYLTESLDSISPWESTLVWSDMFFRRDLSLTRPDLDPRRGPFEWH